MGAVVSALKTAIVGLVASFAIPAMGAADETALRLDAPSSSGLGKALYDTQCAVCHGMDGKGDGEARYLLFPKPADFTSGKLKLRSTPSGSRPTDADLLRTLIHGVPGAGMPSFAFLDENELQAVVEYIKSFMRDFQWRADQAPIDPGSAPPNSPEAVAAGAAVYQKLQCALCHGFNGNGEGEATASILGTFGTPIRPRDFTRGPYKGGSSARDIYLRIATGMEGTPMPAFGNDVITAQQRWQLAYYVQSLCAAPACAATEENENGSIVASRGAAPMDDPLSPVWKSISPRRVRLHQLWNRDLPPPDLTVRSINDRGTIAFLLEWDSTQNDRTEEPEQFADAVAVQLFSGDGTTPIAMGKPGAPVSIWYWNAKWQRDLDRKDAAVSNDIHPWMVEEPYPQPSAAARELGNNRALRQRSVPAEEVTASGFGTLTAVAPPDPQLVGRGIWSEGQWHVVLSWRIGPPSGPGSHTKVAFAVWDGAKRDRDGQKSFSTWYALELGDR
jgi:mono/diheme cytochrome c family protein